MVKEKLINEIKDLKLNHDYRAIVSVSGGVDSMVLLDVLTHLFSNITVVFFDHQTRTQIQEEKAMVSNYCLSKNICFQSFVLDISKEHNFQSFARDLRYSYLNSLAEKHVNSYVFTGHHLDDLTESYLMMKLENSQRFQMSKFYIINNITYVKPFLYIKKSQLYEYAKLYNIKFFEDSSNKELIYFRNKTRRLIQEKLLINPDLYNEVIANNKKYIALNKQVDYIYNEISKNNVFDIPLLLTYDKPILSLLIIKQLLENNITPKTKYIQQIIKNLTSNKPNLFVSLENNYQYTKAYNKAYIEQNIIDTPSSLILEYGDNILQNNEIFTFFPHIDNNENLFAKICYNKLEFPLISRTRKNGDVLDLTFGRKKLKDFLIDKKIPLNLRDKLVIITDSNDTILLIPGFYVNKSLGNKNKLYYKFQEKSNA